MNEERGSISLLGLFLTLGLLLFSAVLLDSSSLYLQKRQLANLSDALALDLADLIQNGGDPFSSALVELEALDATGRETQLIEVAVDVPRVTVSLCQQPSTVFNLYGVLQVPADQVCSRSSATSF